jgi:DNA replication ATP-dependent helicase Dna2
MRLSRNHQSKFYYKEIEAIMKEYQSYLNSGVKDLLNRNELFIGKYVYSDMERGNVVFSFEKQNIPSIKVPYTALSMRLEYSEPETLNNIKYIDFRPKARKSSNSLPIFYYPEENDSSKLLIGFHDIDIDFRNYLNEGQNVYFGRKDPPIAYLENLIKITNNISDDSQVSEILDADYFQKEFNPTLVENSDSFYDLFIEKHLEDTLSIIQGPPGTGKTTLISKVCNFLLDQGNSVMCTALSNKSLVEVSEKEIFSEKLIQKRIKKTNLNTNEQKQVPNLVNSKDVNSEKGVLLLTTYYKMSSEAVKLPKGPVFDYIILEEASQAFIGTIAACRLLARKLIIIGDPKQLPPVINQRNPENISKSISILTNSLEMFASNVCCPKYRLTSTYRLIDRAARQTGIFYENSLVSKSDIKSGSPFLDNLPSCFNSNGGTSIIYFDFKSNKLSALRFILDASQQLVNKDKDCKIAILSPFRDSVKILRNFVYPKMSDYIENIDINTIDGVQGMTTQFTILYIPPRSESFSFKLNRFNVATSRSELCTLIVTDKIYQQILPGNELVNQYLKSINF